MKDYFRKLFDAKLTPGTAALKGYEYIDDILVPIKTKNLTTRHFLKLLYENHLKLGISEHRESDYFGIYVPFSELEKLQKLTV